MASKTGFLIRYNLEAWFSAANDKIWASVNSKLNCAYRGKYPYQCPPKYVLQDVKDNNIAEYPKLIEGID